MRRVSVFWCQSFDASRSFLLHASRSFLLMRVALFLNPLGSSGSFFSLAEMGYRCIATDPLSILANSSLPGWQKALEEEAGVLMCALMICEEKVSFGINLNKTHLSEVYFCSGRG